MSTLDPMAVLGPALAAALEKKGFTQLTAVQLAVLDPEAVGRDLRITSQTGSGKTVAIGFTLRDIVAVPTPTKNGAAAPRAIVVAPTRELAKQVEAELSWLFQPLGVRTASVIGGSNYRDERRALGLAPAIVVGTPGRLVDHLERGSIDPSNVGAVVLDEADRMLDMGFRDELDAILERMPEGRLTHLASATFAREVRSLADRVQRNPVHLEGTRLGAANGDIDHVIHLVDNHERLAAIINLLCATPDARSLIFARTRLDVTHIATELDVAGFAVGTLSGDMEQQARSRALSAFKRGQLRALVATDVAARGIDVPEVNEVIHVEAPNDPDAYTHRSGRTGRAGRKGTSAILSSLRELPQALRILKRANLPYRFEPIPTAHEIRSSIDDRIVAALTGDDVEPLEGEEDARIERLAERITEAGDVRRALKRLLVRVGPAQSVEPRDVRRITPPATRPGDPRGERPRTRPQSSGRRDPYPSREAPSAGPLPKHVAQAERIAPVVSEIDAAPRAKPSRPRAASPSRPRAGSPSSPRVATPSKPRASKPRGSTPGDSELLDSAQMAVRKAAAAKANTIVKEAPPPKPSSGGKRSAADEAPAKSAAAAKAVGPAKPAFGRDGAPARSFEPRNGPPSGGRGNAAGGAREGGDGFVPFHVTWGDVHGADARRLLALVCRRGNIRGNEVGVIRVGRTSSIVEVAKDVAADFARAAREKDPRDPRVQIREEHGSPGESQRPAPFEAPRPKPRAFAGKPSAGGKPSPKRMRAR